MLAHPSVSHVSATPLTGHQSRCRKAVKQVLGVCHVCQSRAFDFAVLSGATAQCCLSEGREIRGYLAGPPEVASDRSVSVALGRQGCGCATLKDRKSVRILPESEISDP